MDAEFKYLSMTFFVFNISVIKFFNSMKKYMYSQYMMSFMIHSMK